MTLVSLTNSCRLLAVDPKTLHRWMKLCHLVSQSHPLDARLKCLTSAQIQQLATTHRRVLPDFEPLHCQAEASAFSAPTALPSAPLASDMQPDFPPPVTDLTMHLNCLQAQVVQLQQQLILLTQQLQKEQQWRTSQATFENKSLESSSDKSLESSLDKSLESSSDKSLESSSDKSLESSSDKSLESSSDKSLESSQEKESRRAKAAPPLVDRHKRPCVLPLVEYGTGGKYVVVTPEQVLLDFEPDSPEWFAWLSTLTSFRFVGASGHLTVHRHKRNWSWRASRSIRYRTHSLHLVATESLTLSVLEQAAASLQSLLN